VSKCRSAQRAAKGVRARERSECGKGGAHTGVNSGKSPVNARCQTARGLNTRFSLATLAVPKAGVAFFAQPRIAWYDSFMLSSVRGTGVQAYVCMELSLALYTRCTFRVGQIPKWPKGADCK
jgi:hypothetical protein